MSNPRGPEPAGVSALLALVISATVFFPLGVFGLGAVSALTDADIIGVPGLGQVPGIVGIIAGVAIFAVMTAATVRRPHPTFWSVVTIALLAALAHLLAVWSCVLLQTGNVVVATVVAGDLVRGGASAVLLAAAAVAAWCGVALRRTRASRPRWSWERDDE